MEQNKTNEFENFTENKDIHQDDEETMKKASKEKFWTKQKYIFSVIIFIVYTLAVGMISAGIQKGIIYRQIKDEQSLSNESLEENVTAKEDDDYKISFNQTVTVGDVMELTIESYEWVDEINRSEAEGIYSTHEYVEGEKYFLIKGKIKNIAGDMMYIEDINESDILINDKYKAHLIMNAEYTDGGFWIYSGIAPLKTMNIYAYASVSNEAYDICEKINVTFNILSDSQYVSDSIYYGYPTETYELEIENEV